MEKPKQEISYAQNHEKKAGCSFSACLSIIYWLKTVMFYFFLNNFLKKIILILNSLKYKQYSML